MTAPRIVAEGATYAVTRRCVCRKAFLGWWHPEVDDIFFWCLAVVAAKCGVHLHHAVRVGSHYHLTFTITRKNLGEFLRLLNHQLSCMLNALLEREGYDAPGQLFDGRGTHVMRLMDAEAQLTHLVYERLNPPTAGLSETCDGVPGLTLDPGLWKGAGVRLTRPRIYVRGGEESTVMRLAPPAELYRGFAGDVDGLVHHMGRLERAGERAIAAARTRPAKTPGEVRAINPWDEPVTLREERGRRVPSFKTGQGRVAEVRGAREVRAFRAAHAEANEAWCAGKRDTVYPAGTYEMERFHGARVAQPEPDAWVSAPGRTLEDVKEELGLGEVERDEDLVDRVREVVVEVAEAMVREEPEGDGNGEDEGGAGDEEGPGRRRPRAERHHRLKKLPPRAPEDQPKRIIRLRDERPRGGADPPED